MVKIKISFSKYILYTVKVQNLNHEPWLCLLAGNFHQFPWCRKCFNNIKNYQQQMSGFSDSLSELKSKGKERKYHTLYKSSVSMSNTLNKPEFNTGTQHCVCGTIANKLQYSVSILLTLFVCRTICTRAHTAVLRLDLFKKQTE